MATTTKLKIAVTKSFRLFDFHVYDGTLDETDDASGSDEQSEHDSQQFIIQMFGVNEKGETCSLYVNDYQPFFFVKVGDAWTALHTSRFIDDLKSKVSTQFKNTIVSHDLVDRHKLYGFTGSKTSKFVKIVFQNQMSMRKYKNLWYNYVEEIAGDGGESRTNKKLKKVKFEGTSVELYESNIPPLLRYFHINKISPSGWVSFKVGRVVKSYPKQTTCTYEYICSLKELVPQPQKETRVPYKICSFDIEASSSHGDFPLPIKTYKNLAKNAVDIFLKQAQFLDVAKALVLMKRIILTAFKYDEFEDVDVVYPKQVLPKDRILALIQILNEKSISDAKKANSEDNSHLLTIDAMFDKIKNEAVDNVQEIDGTDDAQSESVVSPKYERSKKPVKINQAKSKLIDILLNPAYDRDEKIQITNDVLTLLFPQLEGDKVTVIGSTFLRYGETRPYFNHCLVLGTCDPVDNVEIQSVATEKDLLLGWAALIQRENPDIIIGYNIFGFDYEFMFRRSQELACEREFLLLSRKIGDVCINETRDPETNRIVTSIESSKLAIASGEYDLRYCKMLGRLQIDMYAYFRRDFNLSSYKLDDVAGEFISDDVKAIVCTEHPDFGQVTELHSKNLMGLSVGDFIHIEISSFTSNYYKNGQKFRVLAIGQGMGGALNIITIAGHEQISTAKPVKWTMAKDDITPQDIFRLADRDASGRAIVAKYCIQDCNLVHHLMNKIDVLTGYIEMANICSVPISFLVFRGQGIKLTSFVAKKCMEKNTLMPDIEKTGDADGYEGAIVLPPKCGMYMDNPVACVDYSSLYPSSMISQNYSHDSKVWSKEYDLTGKLVTVTGERNKAGVFIYDNLPGYHYIDMEFDTFKYIRKTPTSRAEKTKVGTLVCRWAQFPDNKKGIMPAILEELLKARSDTRKMIKTESDPFMQNILDKRQLGYKVTANSLYGQCGSRTSTFYEKDVAAATTATGRQMIIYAKTMIEEVYKNSIYETAKYGKVRTRSEYVYGDTDSVFFTFNLEHPETGEKIVGKPALEMTIELAQEAAKLCSQWLKHPMELSYEKTLMPFILLSKKRYVGMLYETNPDKGKLKFMGLSIKRRDSCDYLKDVYGGILNMLMDTSSPNSIKSAIDFLNQSMLDLVEGRIPMDKLMITKALRGYYKNPNTIGHNVLANRIGKRDPGNKPKPGDRMKFVFIVNQNPKALMGDKIETPEFIIENRLPVDYNHYITNQLMKPLQQLFGLALVQIWECQSKPKSVVKGYLKDMEKMSSENPDLEEFMKLKEKYCSKKIKALLFDKILTRITNEKNGMQPINKFFPSA
jgi:DNA polymerase elongation subunit (family B)